jgi:Kef-type K+ transport system membrane component KefB
VTEPFLLAVTVSATSLGLVVAVLKDAHALTDTVGRTVVAASSVADFAAVLLLSLTFAGMTGDTRSRLVLLVAFAAAVIVLGVAIAAARHSTRTGMVLTRLQDGTAEIRVRGAMVLLIGCVVLAEHVGLETILGAFVAGALVGTLDVDSTTHLKLEAIAYGFLVPVFFVTSGLRLDVAGLVSSGNALVRVPVFLGVLFLARGLPALMFVRAWGPRRTMAAALLQATSLPFIVTATQIGTALGLMSAVTAAALVCAGLLSVLVFPAVATAIGLRDSSGEASPQTGRTSPAG